MLKLNKEQSDSINDIINNMADRLVENPTVKDFKELIELLQDYGYEENEKEKILNDLSTPFEVSAIDSNEIKDEYIEEYKVKLNMPCYKESYLLEFNQIVEKILDKSTYTYSVEEAELVKDLMKLSKKYKEKRISKFV